MNPAEAPTSVFESLRGRLFGLAYGLRFCSTAQWCIIRESRIGDQLDWIKRVQEYLIRHWKRQELPEYFGIGPEAPPEHGLYRFLYNAAFLEAFKRIGIEGLFSHIPEDFTLLRKRDYRNPWLHTTTHEQQGALHLAAQEKTALGLELPAISNMLSDDPPFKIWG